MSEKNSIKDPSSTFSEKKNKHKKKSLDDDDEMNNLNSIPDSAFGNVLVVFLEQLWLKEWRRVSVKGDGNLVVYGSQGPHIAIRQYIISLIVRLPLTFKPMFSKEVTLRKTRLDTFAVYCERMFQVQPCVASDPYRWSGCLKIYAVYLLYKRPCIVHLMDTLLNRMFLKHCELK